MGWEEQYNIVLKQIEKQMTHIQEYLTGVISYNELWRSLADSGELDLLPLALE